LLGFLVTSLITVIWMGYWISSNNRINSYIWISRDISVTWIFYSISRVSRLVEVSSIILYYNKEGNKAT
jgi:hypothetical protein